MLDFVLECVSWSTFIYDSYQTTPSLAMLKAADNHLGRSIAASGLSRPLWRWGRWLIVLFLSMSLVFPGIARADLDLTPLRRDVGDSAQPAKSNSKLLEQAKSGDPNAQYTLAMRFDGQTGHTRNYEQAAFWYRRAAEQGHTLSQISLALMYQAGQGVAKDPVQAASWFQRAATSGHPSAQHSLGLLYYEGLGVAKNYETARSWFESAARGGNSASMNNLGVIYTLGQGTKADAVEGMAWFMLAEAVGDPDGKKNMSLLAKELKPAQIEAGKQRLKVLQQVLEQTQEKSPSSLRR